MRKNYENKKVLRYSIKKYTVGTLSVVVGAFIFFGGNALAHEDNSADEKIEINIEEKTEKEIPKNPIDNVEKETNKEENLEKEAPQSEKEETIAQGVGENTGAEVEKQKSSEENSKFSEKEAEASDEKEENSASENKTISNNVLRSANPPHATNSERAISEGEKISLTPKHIEDIKGGIIRLEGNKVDPSLMESDVLINNEDGSPNDKNDFDDDTLPTNKELYVYKKGDKKYVGYYSHPYLKDTDGDGIPDNEEKEGEVLKWNVSDRDLAMMQELAYREDEYINEVLDETRKDITVYKDRLEYRMMNKELAPYWKVKRTYHDGNGFDAVLFETKSSFPYLKDGTAQVLAIRGTSGVGGDTTADIALWFGRKPKQATTVEEIIKNYALGGENLTNLYITGHSLGGYLTQVAFTHAYQLMKEKKGTTPEEQAKFDNFYNNILKRAVTFNAPRIRTNNFQSQDFWNKGLYSTELAKAGKIKHYVVDNDSVVGKFYNDKELLTSIGKSAAGHGSRSYFEERVNALGYFTVGKRNTMDKTGYRDPKTSETRPMDIVKTINMSAGGKLTEDSIKNAVGATKSDSVKIGELRNLEDFDTTSFGTYVLGVDITDVKGDISKKYIEINVTPNWFYFNNALNTSKNILKEKVDLKHKIQSTLQEYNEAKSNLENKIRSLDAFQTDFDERVGTQSEIDSNMKELIKLHKKYISARSELRDIKKFKLEIIKVPNGKVPNSAEELNKSEKISTLVLDEEIENPQKEVLEKLNEDENYKNLVLLDTTPSYSEIEESEEALYHKGLMYVSEVGKLRVHNENELIEEPFGVERQEDQQIVFYKVPKDKKGYYTVGEDGIKIDEKTDIAILTGDQRFKDVDLYYHKYVARDLYVTNEKNVENRRIPESEKGDGTINNPYQGLRLALKNARDGDTLHFVSNVVVSTDYNTDYRLVANPDYKVGKAGTSQSPGATLTVDTPAAIERNSLRRPYFKIDKNVTIDGAGHELIMRGVDLEMYADTTLKNMNLSMIPGSYSKSEYSPLPRIFLNDHNAVFENVTTLLSEIQNDVRPILVAGRAADRNNRRDGENFGTGANVTIINNNAEMNNNISNDYKLKHWTVFENIIAGNEDGSEKTTPTTMTINREVMSLKGVDLANIVGKVTIKTLSNDIKAYLHGEKNADDSTITFGTEEGDLDRHFSHILIDRVKNIEVINSGLSLDKNSNIELNKLEVTSEYDVDFGEVANKMTIKELSMDKEATFIIPLMKDGLSIGSDKSEKLKLRFNMYPNSPAEYGDTIVHVEEGMLSYHEDYSTEKMFKELITEKQDGEGHNYILGVEKYLPLEFVKDGEQAEVLATIKGVKYIDDNIENYSSNIAKIFENDLKGYVMIENSYKTLVEEVYGKDNEGALYPEKLRVRVKEVGHLRIHNEDGTIEEVPFTIENSGVRQKVSYELPRSKFIYYTMKDDRYDREEVLPENNYSGELTDSNRFVNIDVYSHYKKAKLRFKVTDNDGVEKYFQGNIEAKYKSDDLDAYSKSAIEDLRTDENLKNYVLDLKDGHLVGDIKDFESIVDELSEEELESLKRELGGFSEELNNIMFVTINLHEVGRLHRLTPSGEVVTSYLIDNSGDKQRVYYKLPTDDNVVYRLHDDKSKLEAGEYVLTEDARTKDTYIDVIEKTTRHFIEGTTTELVPNEAGAKNYKDDAVLHNNEKYYYDSTENDDTTGITTHYYKRGGSVVVNYISTTGESLLPEKFVVNSEGEKLEKARPGLQYDVSGPTYKLPAIVKNGKLYKLVVGEEATGTTTPTPVSDIEKLRYENGIVTKTDTEIVEHKGRKYAKASSVVEAGKVLDITYVYKEVVIPEPKVEKEKIPYTVIYIADPEKDFGDDSELGGVDGSKITTITYIIDEKTKEVVEKKIESAVLMRPKVITKGTKTKEERTTLPTVYKADESREVGTPDSIEEGEEKVATTTYTLDAETGKVTPTTIIKEGRAKVITKGTKTKEDTTPYKTIYIADPNREITSEVIVQEGKDKVVTTNFRLDAITGTISKEVVLVEGEDRIVIKGTKAKIENEELDFETNYIADSNLVAGEQEEQQAGQKGSKITTTTYTLNLTTGEVTASKPKVEIKEPQARIIKVGTKTKVVSEKLPFATVYKENPEKDFGDDSEAGGIDGEKITTTTYTLNPKTGEVKASEPESKIKWPTEKIVTFGTKPKVEIKTEKIIIEYEADETAKAYSRTTITQGRPKVTKKIITYTLDKRTGKITSSEKNEEVAGVATIIKVGTKPEIETTPYKTIYIADPNREITSEIIVQEGKDKVVTTNFRLDQATGIISEEITTDEGEDKVVIKGTKAKVEKEEIPFKVRYEVDSRLKFGDKIATIGKFGEKVTTTLYTLDPQTGKLSATPTTSITEAIDSVISIGNIEIKEEKIPVTTTYIEDKTLLRGQSSTTLGEIGRKEIIKTYKLDDKGNLIESTTTEKIVIEMKPAIVHYGTKVEEAPSEEALEEYPLDKVPHYHEVPNNAPSEELPEFPLDKVPQYHEVPNNAPVEEALPEFKWEVPSDTPVEEALPEFKWEVPSESPAEPELPRFEWKVDDEPVVQPELPEFKWEVPSDAPVEEALPEFKWEVPSDAPVEEALPEFKWEVPSEAPVEPELPRFEWKVDDEPVVQPALPEFKWEVPSEFPVEPELPRFEWEVDDEPVVQPELPEFKWEVPSESPAEPELPRFEWKVDDEPVVQPELPEFKWEVPSDAPVEEVLPEFKWEVPSVVPKDTLPKVDKIKTISKQKTTLPKTSTKNSPELGILFLILLGTLARRKKSEL